MTTHAEDMAPAGWAPHQPRLPSTRATLTAADADAPRREPGAGRQSGDDRQRDAPAAGDAACQPFPVVRLQARVGHVLGLHMRPASRFVAVARKFNADIRVRYNGNDANGKSLLDLLCLAASEGNLLDLEARGHDAEAAIGTLAELLTTRHDEAQGEGLA